MARPVKITRHVALDECPVNCPASQRNPDKPCGHRVEYVAECRRCAWTKTGKTRAALEQSHVWSHERAHTGIGGAVL